MTFKHFKPCYILMFQFSYHHSHLFANFLLQVICNTAKPTRRMAIANRTCVSFCNQPKAKFGYLTRVTPVCRCLHPFCGWKHLAMPRESKAHFALPWIRPGTITVNVTWMKRGFNACQMHRRMYPSIFNHFPVIQPISSKFRHFSTFWPPLGTPLGQSR